MKKIFKYRLPFMETAHIVLPTRASILRVDGIDGAIWIWAIVDTDAPLVIREFKLFKTGGDMPEDIMDYNYHGCGAIHIQMELMMYVFDHVLIECREFPYQEPPPPFNWKEAAEKEITAVAPQPELPPGWKAPEIAPGTYISSAKVADGKLRCGNCMQCNAILSGECQNVR